MVSLKKILAFLLLLTLNFTWIDARPTSLFWTNCTTDVLPAGTGRVESYNYFTIYNKRNKPGEFFNPDIGVTMGVFSWQNINVEAGLDYIGGARDPFYFNAKIGMAENVEFPFAPTVSVGIYNIGTRSHTTLSPGCLNGICLPTNQDIVDVVLGKTLPYFGGKLYIGGFCGRKSMGKNRAGVLVGYSRGFLHAIEAQTGMQYDKWTFLADYASGKNTIGGGGIAVSYHFTPYICLRTGPVWFNTKQFNGRWKWSVQFLCDVPLAVFDFVRRDCPETYCQPLDP